MLKSAIPDSQGKINAIARSKQLTDFQWTPLKDIPSHTKTDRTIHPAGVTVTGMPYSSVEAVDKFIGENVSFETFITALNNPESVLYTRDQYAYGNASTYYGCVCNQQVRYALNIPTRYTTSHWGWIDGMRKIADHGEYTVEDIELCDVLHVFNERNHVTLITDLLSDENGKIVKIEVSEAVRTHCVRAQYDVDEYFEKYKIFDLWRYDYVDCVPAPIYELDENAGKNPGIALNYGTKANYADGRDVLISVFNDGENEIEISKDNSVIETVKFCGKGSISREFDGGYYSVKLKNTGEEVFFCVNAPKINYVIKNNVISVDADAGDARSELIGMDFRLPGEGRTSLVSVETLTDEERMSGKIVRFIPQKAGNFKLSFRNKYGIWSTGLIKI